MGEVIYSDRIEKRAADIIVRRFNDEVAALGRDGIIKESDVLAFARTNPQSAIRTMLDEPGDDTGDGFLSALQRAWRKPMKRRQS